MDAPTTWEVIHDWIDRNYPEMRQHLNGPANPTHFDTLEQAIGFKLPDEFKAFYMIHDGSAVIPGRPYRVCRVIAGLPLMSLQGILKEWEFWAALVEDENLLEDLKDEYRASPEGVVKPAYADRGWVPFAGEENHFVALDFAPGLRGRTGQVINFGRDDYYRHAIAPTFAGFMGFVADLFTTGEITRNPEVSYSLVLKRTGKDLLLSLPDLPSVQGIGGFAS